MYENVVGTTAYTYVGTSVYLHLTGHSSSWYSTVINASSTEYRTIGWVSSGDCGTSPHLHHGRRTNTGGSLNDAHWLNASTPSPQLGSNEITLYK